MTTHADTIRKHKDKAAQLLAKGKLDAGLAEYRQVLHMNPADLASRQKVAEILGRLGRRTEAIAEYQRVAGKYAADGLLLKAIAISKVILQLDANHTATMRALTDLYARHRSNDRMACLPAAMTGALRPAVTPMPAEERLVIGASEAVSLDVAGEVEIEVSGEPTVTGMEIVVGELKDVEIPSGSMPHIPLFSDLGANAFMALSDGVEMVSLNRGDIIVREGEIGTSMFAIVQGSVNVVRMQDNGEQRVVAEMKEGSFFGEMALVAHSPRVATVVAAEDTLLFEFSRERVDGIIREHPSVRGVIERFYRERLLANLLRSSAIFRPFSAGEKQQIVDSFVSRTVQPGTMLLEQGQPGNGFYLLLRGRCDVFHTHADGKQHAYPSMKEGDVFGEVSMLTGQPVTASVRASAACTVLRLSRAPFQQLVLSHPEVRDMIKRISEERLQRTSDLLKGFEPPLTEYRV